MQAAAARMDLAVEVVTVPTLYPSGGAKQLIQAAHRQGSAHPASCPPISACRCFNVGTAYAMHRAVHHGEPLISRLVTLTGNVRAAAAITRC